MNVLDNTALFVTCRRQILEMMSNRDVQGSQKIFDAVRHARKELMNYKTRSTQQRSTHITDENQESENTLSGDWVPSIGERAFVPSINAHATVVQVSKDAGTVSLKAGLFQMQARTDQVLPPQ